MFYVRAASLAPPGATILSTPEAGSAKAPFWSELEQFSAAATKIGTWRSV